VAKLLVNAGSGTTYATAAEGRGHAHLAGLLDARQRLLDVHDTDAASRLSEVICARLRDQGDLAQAAALGQATLEAMPSPSVAAARWLHELGTIAQLRGDDGQAQNRHMRAVQMFAEVGDAAGVARGYDSLGALAQAQGDYQQAERYYQAATCFEAPQVPWSTATPAPDSEVSPDAEQPEPEPEPTSPSPGALAFTDPAPTDPAPATRHVSEAACAEAARAGATRAGAERTGAERAGVTWPKETWTGAAPLGAADPAWTWSGTTWSLAAETAEPAGAWPAAALAGEALDGTGPAGAAQLEEAGAEQALPSVQAGGDRAGSGTASSEDRRAAAQGRRRGRRARRPGRIGGGLRPAALAAGTVVAAASVAIAATASDSSAGRAADRADLAGARAAAGPADAVSAGDARDQAAAWVAQMISASAVVGCDPAMCTALRAHGVAAGNLLTIGADGQSDPLGSDIVMATAAIRGTLGTRLAPVYAPLVLARFGTGSARIEVRVTAPDGSAAYLRALRADQAARATAGQQLLGNPRLSESPAARHDLTTGQVDPRLLTTLAALTAVHGLRIVQFGASGPGADPRVPLPSAEITAAEPGPASAGIGAVAAFLRAQRSPYLASSVVLTRLSSGQPALRVTFGEPSPLDLLGPAT
jgi:hypothetical protein